MSPLFITALLGIVLTVMTLSQVVPSISEAIFSEKIEVGIGREEALVQQIIRYRTAEGVYPATVADLAAKNYLAAGDADNGFGGGYTFVIDAPKGVVSVSTSISDATQRAQYLANYRHVFRPADIGGGVVLAKFILPSAGSLGAPLPTATGIPISAVAPSAATNTYWYDTSGPKAILKVSDGTSWVAADVATAMAAPSAANIVASTAALPLTGTDGDVRYVRDSINNVLNTMVYYNGAWIAIGGTSAASVAVSAGLAYLTAPVAAGAPCAWDDGMMAYDSYAKLYACSDPAVNSGGLPTLSCVALGRVTYDITGAKFACGMSKAWAQSAAPTCTTEYIPVPAFTLPDGTYVPEFCVMKYEAKKSSFVPGDRTVTGTNAAYAVSSADQPPWVNVTQQDARTACAATGAHLIKENEWLSLAHQVTSVGSNWSGGSVGSGFLFVGHSDDTPSARLEADTDDTNGYYGTGDSAVSPGDSGFGPSWSSNVAQAYQGQRRTLTLPNGQVIWDLAGNAWEWVDETMPAVARYHGGASSWMSFNVTDGAPVASNMPLNKRPPNGFNANQGMGRYFDGASTAGAYSAVSEAPDYCIGNCSPTAAFLRGGGYNHGIYTGVFALQLYQSGSFGGGFRCSR